MVLKSAGSNPALAYNMYWIPLIPINNNWTGLALPVPLQKNWISLINLNEGYCKIKNKTYTLSKNKLFSTPVVKLDHNVTNFDKEFTNNFSSIKGIKITLSGRLKGISKAKNLVITNGVIKSQSIINKLSYYSRPVYTKWGTIGLKVIC